MTLFCLNSELFLFIFVPFCLSIEIINEIDHKTQINKITQSKYHRVVPGTRVTVMGVYSTMEGKSADAGNKRKERGGVAGVGLRTPYLHAIGIDVDDPTKGSFSHNFTPEEEEEFASLDFFFFLSFLFSFFLVFFFESFSLFPLVATHVSFKFTLPF